MCCLPFMHLGGLWRREGELRANPQVIRPLTGISNDPSLSCAPSQPRAPPKGHDLRPCVNTQLLCLCSGQHLRGQTAHLIQRILFSDTPVPTPAPVSPPPCPVGPGMELWTAGRRRCLGAVSLIALNQLSFVVLFLLDFLFTYF